MSLKIKRKDFLSAQKVVARYTKQVNEDLVGQNGYTCICCKTNKVKLLSPKEGVRDVLEQERDMWNDGTVTLVGFGYGSKFDTERFYMAICDTCMTTLKKEGLVVDYLGLYFKKNG